MSIRIIATRRHAISQLLLGADWACAHGDAGGLAHVLRQLAARSAGPLEDPLRDVRAAVGRESDPFACWAAVRSALFERLRDAEDTDVDLAVQHC